MSCPLAIGIDLGGTNCRGVLVSNAGQVHAWRSMETCAALGLNNLLDRLTGFCRELMEVAGGMGSGPVGIGCGVAGVVSPSGKVLTSPNLQFLNEFALQDYLTSRLELPALVVNDANAIAWGEARFGGGLDFESFLTITLGTGVGGGLVLHRRLWQGACGGAGEIGHLAVEVEGRPCGCGSHGCLEQYASGQGIQLNYRDLGGSEGALIDSMEIARLARQGDNVAREAFNLAGRYLGQAVAGVANLLNLEGVLFAGGLSSCFDLLLPALQEELDCRAFAVNSRLLRLATSRLGEKAGTVGAAHMLFDHLKGS